VNAAYVFTETRMSTLAHRASAVVPWRDVRLPPAGRSYFLMRQSARGLWVIRENTGTKAGIFASREAALRFARLECPDENFAVVYVPDGIEFDYAARSR
jgi:hypothetical protein